MKYILILIALSLASCTPDPDPEHNVPVTETGDPDHSDGNEPGVGEWEPGDSGETPAEPE